MRVLEPAEVAEKAGYTRPHTIHCGPEGIYVAALADPQGNAPGGIFLMDHETFDIRGPLGDRVVSLKDLSSSIWVWFRDGQSWAVKKVIEIPAEPADPELLPPLLKGFKAVPPLVTDIDLSMDDHFLDVSCCAPQGGERQAQRRAADGGD